MSRSTAKKPPSESVGSRRAPPSTLYDLFALIRPYNILLIGLGVVVGRLLAGGRLGDDTGAVLITLASACLVGAGANVSNDLFDREVDRKNRPDRPIPAGRIQPVVAGILAILATGFGIVAAAFVSSVHVYVACGIAMLLWLYNGGWKNRPLVGNVIVALSVAGSLLFGALAPGLNTTVFGGMGFAFLLTLSREIAKDVEDVDGDLAAGARTLPVVAGVSKSCLVAMLVAVLAVVVTPIPYLSMGFSSAYLALVLVADAILLTASWQLIRGIKKSAEISHASFSLKAAMVWGLLALAVAGDFSI